MEESNEIPPPEKEELRKLIANSKEVLSGKSNDQILLIFHKILDELGLNSTDIGMGKSLRHFDDTSALSKDNNDMSTEIPIPVEDLKQTNGKNSRLDEETHPMHSDLILKAIFEYCSVNTLMNCRLVCKKWLTLSLKSWRQKALLVTDELINQNAVEELVKEGSEYRQTPFKCYDVVDYESDSDNFELKNKILNTFGSSIQYLDIDWYDLDLGISLIFSKLPDLRHLKMRFYYDSFVSEWQDDPFQKIQESPLMKVTKLQLHFAILLPRNRDQLEGVIQWIKFLERMPALTCLHVKYKLESFYSGGKRVHYGILREILQAVLKVRESEKFTTLNLEELDIMVHANHSCISIPFSKTISDIIIQSRLPLERLSIDIGITDTASCVSDLLAAHGETLKYLKAVSAPDKYYLKKKLTLGPFLVNKVSLPKLKELELLNGCVWALHILGSLEVSKLEILRIEEMKLKQHRRFEKLSWKSVDANCREKHLAKILEPLHFPNLQRFYYSGPRHLSSNELQLLAKAMPNVTDLGVPLSAKTFPVICEIWSGLKSLRVGQVFEGPYPLIDDYAITGLPLEDISRSKNITDLKELWSFELDGNSGESYSRTPMITDTSVVFGFLLLPKLTVLRIGAICKFSSDVKKTLESHVSDVTINERRVNNVEENNRNSSDSSDDESELESVYSEPDSG